MASDCKASIGLGVCRPVAFRAKSRKPCVPSGQRGGHYSNAGTVGGNWTVAPGVALARLAGWAFERLRVSGSACPQLSSLGRLGSAPYGPSVSEVARNIKVKKFRRGKRERRE